MSLFQDTVAEHVATVLASAEALDVPMQAAQALLVGCLKAGGRVLICGNGGSAADAQHFAAELTGRFERNRPALAGIALSTDTSALTAIANDFGYDKVFSRQVEALGRPGDVLVAISTSGNSPNVIAAATAAQAIGMTAIGMTGEGGGALAEMVDVLLAVPCKRVARVQEVHEVCLHTLALGVENAL